MDKNKKKRLFHQTDLTLFLLFTWYRPSTQSAGITKESSSCAVTQMAAWHCGTSETPPSLSRSPSLMVRHAPTVFMKNINISSSNSWGHLGLSAACYLMKLAVFSVCGCVRVCLHGGKNVITHHLSLIQPHSFLDFYAFRMNDKPNMRIRITAESSALVQLNDSHFICFSVNSPLELSLFDFFPSWFYLFSFV